MSTNRIRQYEQVWKSQSAVDSPLPEGFAAYSMAHLNPAQRAAIAAASPLYQWAFDRAREEADVRFVNNWII